MSWLTRAMVGRAVLVLLSATVGALVDAGLMDGAAGEALQHGLAALLRGLFGL